MIKFDLKTKAHLFWYKTNFFMKMYSSFLVFSAPKNIIQPETYLVNHKKQGSKWFLVGFLSTHFQVPIKIQKNKYFLPKMIATKDKWDQKILYD